MEFFDHLLGLHQDKLYWYQMCIRAVIVFFATILYIRVAGRRSFGKKSALDLVMVLVLGATLSKAIIGEQPFFPILAGAFVLALLHRLFSFLSFHNKAIERFIKGAPILLVKDGRSIPANMQKEYITEVELQEAVRIIANVSDISEIKEGYFEISGDISTVPFKKK